ncbi:MAG: hypothetical protein ACR2FY_02950 [Pirellulaceae bacterium]
MPLPPASGEYGDTIAKASDMVTTPGAITFAEGESEKTLELVPNDDVIVELNETFNFWVYGETTDAYVVSGAGVQSVRILDDEWRWITPTGTGFSTGSNGDVNEDYHSSTIVIENHPYSLFSLPSYLWGNYSLDAIRFNPQNSFEGPNKLQLAVNGLFRDGGWFDWTETPDDDTIGLQFSCDSQSGLITEVGGTNNAGGGTAQPIKAIAVHGEPNMINNSSTVHSVQVRFSGDVGVDGSFSVTGTATYYVGLEYTQNQNWGRSLGPWISLGQLTCARGASN